MSEQLYAALMWERFGRPPLAEYRRPLTGDVGDGRPDTRRAIKSRRRALCVALDETRHVAGSDSNATSPMWRNNRGSDGRYVA